MHISIVANNDLDIENNIFLTANTTLLVTSEMEKRYKVDTSIFSGFLIRSYARYKQNPNEVKANYKIISNELDRITTQSTKKDYVKLINTLKSLLK